MDFISLVVDGRMAVVQCEELEVRREHVFRRDAPDVVRMVQEAEVRPARFFGLLGDGSQIDLNRLGHARAVDRRDDIAKIDAVDMDGSLGEL